VLQCVAVCCSVLQSLGVLKKAIWSHTCIISQCAAACFVFFQCVAVAGGCQESHMVTHVHDAAACCSVLHRVAPCCTVLQRVAVYCSVLHRVAVFCSVIYIYICTYVYV